MKGSETHFCQTNEQWRCYDDGIPGEEEFFRGIND